LQQQLQRAAFLLRRHHPDRDERKQKRRCEIVRAPGWNKYAVERSQTLRQRGWPTIAAHLRVQADGSYKTVTGEKPDEQKQQPERARRKEFTKLFRQQSHKAR
jgi:hypothetical protein